MPQEAPEHPHLRRLFDAVQQERVAESRALAEALARPVAEQEALGVRWPPCRVMEATPTWRGTEVVLKPEDGLHEGIKEGEAVTVTVGSVAVPGRVLRVDLEPPAAVVELRDSEVEVAGAQRVTVVRRFDPTGFIRALDALCAADSLDSPLRTALLLADYPAGGAVDAVLDGVSLDPAQAVAASVALSDAPLSVVHGPPGTGKTWLLGHVLRALVRRGERPWALAESNAAVDHLVATCRVLGLDVVRLGHPARVRADNAGHTVDARVSAGPLKSAVVALERDLRRASGWRERRSLRRELRDLRRQAWDHAVSSADVVCSTLGTLAGVVSRRSGLPPATVAVVDEATQAAEPSVWTAVPHVERMVLVGDPEQLGPVCKVPGSMLEDSILQRVLRQGRHPAPMLERQHRMSAAVQALVSVVYGPAYVPHPDVAEQRLTDRPGVVAAPLTERAHLWIDTAGTGCEEAEDPLTRSRFNVGEVSIVAAVVDQLRALSVPREAVVVVAPYSAQVARLRQCPALAGIEVTTVNSIQGREAPVVVASWVRSNSSGEVGFVADPRRLTVLWSRARCLLVQVGDTATLSGQPRFSSALAHLEATGDLVSAWEPPWLEAWSEG